MENNIMTLVGAFIGIAIMLYIGIQILGNAVQDCSTLSDYNSPINSTIPISHVESYIGLDGYEFRKAITINHSQVSGSIAHLNFPVLISIENDSDLENIQSNGEDIRFTSSDGTTLLNYEIQSFTNSITDGSLISWVSIPMLSTSVDTILYMYYSNPITPDGQNPHAVWSNYQYVAHLNNDPTGTNSILDSTVHPHHGTPVNEVLSVDGKIGKALSFDGDDDYIDLGTILPGDKLMMNGEDISISVLIKPELTGDTFQRIISKSNGGAGSNGYDFVLDVNRLILYINGAHAVNTSSIIFDSNKFYHIIATKPSGSPNGKIYLDGIDVTNNNPANNVIPNTETNMRVGTWNHNTAREFNGTIEMLSISKLIPTDDMIVTEYNTKTNPSSFYGISSQESNITIIIEPPTITVEENYWYTQCVTNNNQTQNAYNLLVIILIVVAAVAILSVVRMV